MRPTFCTLARIICIQRKIPDPICYKSLRRNPGTIGAFGWWRWRRWRTFLSWLWVTFRNTWISPLASFGAGNNGAIDQGVSQRARYAADIRARCVRILPSSPDMMVLDWEISQRSPTSSGSDITNYVNGSRTRYIIVPGWFLTEGVSSLKNLFRWLMMKMIK